MILISCDNCATVLDAVKLVFPDKYQSNGDVNTDGATWDGESFVVHTPCPSCGEKIYKPENLK